MEVNINWTEYYQNQFFPPKFNLILLQIPWTPLKNKFWKKSFKKNIFLRNLGEFHVLIEKFRINEKIVISWKEKTAIWEQDEMLKGFEKPKPI